MNEDILILLKIISLWTKHEDVIFYKKQVDISWFGDRLLIKLLVLSSFLWVNSLNHKACKLSPDYPQVKTCLYTPIFKH